MTVTVGPIGLVVGGIVVGVLLTMTVITIIAIMSNRKR